ncbi:hypothetical protein B0A54_00552 [Friedmanniomyces endolithicus]|uniref:Voltage-gated hydrogen channel 1 n=1 Tax=Friedmanniomyces endolithicus TaxID=329885 RepID=A0A4U0VGS9_9PEZI|nr:hypothetical protein B0A54_00552 [Friedmanniomyces endolithicus]
MLNAAEQRPLLPSDHVHHTPRPDPASPSTMSITTGRNQTKRYLTSKYGHYSVLALVSVDITAIFADLILQLLTCEGRIPARDGDTASNVLGVFSLIFSCLFMLELVASVWAFGWTYALPLSPCHPVPSIPALTPCRYFHTPFHCLDATVILAGFVLDVLLKGIVEEVSSLVVVLRLWRVFKIIEELSAGAEERMEPMQERTEELEKENVRLKGELEGLRAQVVQRRPYVEDMTRSGS